MSAGKTGEFVQRTPEEEFLQYAESERRRLLSSDQAFDDKLYLRAVELVLSRIKKASS